MIKHQFLNSKLFTRSPSQEHCHLGRCNHVQGIRNDNKIDTQNVYGISDDNYIIPNNKNPNL